MNPVGSGFAGSVPELYERYMVPLMFQVYAVDLAARSRAASPRIPAVAICQGTPLCNEIVAHGASCLDEATDCATAAIAARFGSSAVDGRIQAHVVTVER